MNDAQDWLVWEPWSCDGEAGFRVYNKRHPYKDGGYEIHHLDWVGPTDAVAKVPPSWLPQDVRPGQRFCLHGVNLRVIGREPELSPNWFVVLDGRGAWWRSVRWRIRRRLVDVNRRVLQTLLLWGLAPYEPWIALRWCNVWKHWRKRARKLMGGRA